MTVRECGYLSGECGDCQGVWVTRSVGDCQGVWVSDGGGGGIG